MLRPVQAEDQLHHRPPLAGLRPEDALLHRTHELVPLPVGRIVVRPRKILRRIETVARLAIHEHSPAEEEDLHLGHADLTQAREDLRPHALVLLLVSRDEPRIVAQIERHSVYLHVMTSVPPRPAPVADRAPWRCRRRSAPARRWEDRRWPDRRRR